MKKHTYIYISTNTHDGLHAAKTSKSHEFEEIGRTLNARWAAICQSQDWLYRLMATIIVDKQWLQSSQVLMNFRLLLSSCGMISAG